MSIQIILKNMDRLYPVNIISSDNEDKAQYIDELYNSLNQDGYINIISKRFCKYGDELPQFTGKLNKEDIISIVNIEEEDINLDEILTLSEAAKKWGLADGSTIRKAIEREKFNNTEIKQAGAVWITTYKAMTKVFGEVKNKRNLIDEKRFEALLAVIYFMDAQKGAIKKYKETSMMNSHYLMDTFIKEKTTEKYNVARAKLDSTLIEAYKKLKEGNSIVFLRVSRGKEKIKNIINNEEELKYFINTLDEKRKITTNTKIEIMEKLFNS